MNLLHSRVVGSGSPLVILHGFLGMSDNWKSLGMQFAEAGFEVHLVDQRNHGHSFWSDEFNYRILAEDLLNYLDHRNILETSIIGHSMGGKTAMHFACLNSDRVQNLIIADIGPKYYPPHHQIILEALKSLNPSELTSRNEADKVLSRFIKSLGIRQFLLKNLYWEKPGVLGLRMNLKVLSSSMEAIGTPLSQGLYFAGPTVFIRGGASDYILDEDLPLISEHFPKAVLETIKDTGHWLHAEKPKEFLECCLKALKAT
ncbi:MAG: hypothetical protein RLZZ241_78 [Bacteroidota bacterium]|jgi:pimeloyl-ACP methyl ester carboxylesterase